MNYTIIGIDQSLTNSGICIIQYRHKTENISYFNILPKKLREAPRLKYIKDELQKFIKKFKPDIAVMEGYSPNSYNRPFALGELGGIVKLTLLEEQIPTYIVPPKSMKKYVAAHGDAPKSVIMAIYQLKEENQADARGLAEIGRSIITDVTTTRAQCEVVKMVKDNPDNVKKKAKKKKRIPRVSKTKQTLF